MARRASPFQESAVWPYPLRFPLQKWQIHAIDIVVYINGTQDYKQVCRIM